MQKQTLSSTKKNNLYEASWNTLPTELLSKTKIMKNFLFIIIASATLSSCGLYKNYERPADIKIPNNIYRDSTKLENIIDADTTNFGNMPWREVFVDARLQNLIEKALANNTNLQQADLTIRQAEAGLKISRLAFLPSVSLSPQGTITSWDFSKATKTYSIPVQASWQIDAFGTLRNAKKQSEMSLMQTRAAKQATRTSIIASVANLYYTLEMLDAQLATTKATAKLWDKNVSAMETMFKAGITNSSAVSQAKANRLSILTTIPTMQASIQKAENSLCALLHEAPHSIERGSLEDVKLPSSLSAGVPMQLLSNRPDVRSAELQMAYAFYGVLGARGAFYPKITLSGAASWTNSGGLGVVNPGKILASAVGSLVQPLFAQGKLRANLDIAKAQQESATLSFEQKLLDAGNEVNEAIDNYNAAKLRIDGNKELVKELTKSVETTDFIFKNDNSVSYLETLTAQQSLLQAQLNLISAKLDKVQAVISLYQALGGGRD